MSKKAFTMQFHWIFVLVAGAIILAFFFSLVQKQRVLSQEKLSITLSTDIEAVFSGAIESKGTAQPLIIPGTGIAFSCSQGCTCSFMIGKKATDFRDKIIFAPDLIEDQDAIAWAQEFKMPFRVTNFLYLTNPNIKYYVVYDPSNQMSQTLYRNINTSLPPGLNLAILTGLDLARVEYEGFQETKFVFLDTGDVGSVEAALESLDRDFRKELVSAALIQPSAKIVHFFEKEQKELDFQEFPSIYVDESSIFAAMFSADRLMYECGMQSAFARMVRIAQVVLERTELLQQNVPDQCIYNLAPFNSIIDNAKVLAATPRIYTESGAVTEIISQKETLEHENRNMIQLSCPEMY